MNGRAPASGGIMDEHDRTREEIRVVRDDDEAARDRTPANQGDVLGISRVPAGGMSIPAERGKAETDQDEEAAPALSEDIEEHHGLGSRDVTEGTAENHYRPDRTR